MIFNISSLFDRGFSRVDTSKKEKIEKPVKTEAVQDSEGFENTAATKFERVAKIERAEQKNGISSGNEKRLSDKAKEMLATLREKYGDLDIFVGNTDDELASLSQYGNKEFSVIFSNQELERMADEAEYAENQVKSMEAALEEAKGIAEKLFEAGDRTQVNSFSISFKDDGTKKLFASLERKPETTIEKVAENKHIRQFDSYTKDFADSVKRTVVSAATADELYEKIKNVNWDEIEDSRNGDRYNYSV